MSHVKDFIIPLFTQPGYFVEIGCWDGEHISQTAELERIGWKGVCVDPFPVNFEKRSCKVIPNAVTKDGLPREFVRVTIDRRHGGDVSYFSGFRDSINFHWPIISEHCDYQIIDVECCQFSDIVQDRKINFLSVDTEGSELEIISSIDFERYDIDCIMFEHNGVENGVGELLVSKGYKLHKHLEIDDIYVK